MKLLWKTSLAVLFLAAMLPQAPAAKMFTEPYEGPAVLAYAGPTDCDDPVRSVGIACVALAPDVEKIDLRILDRSGLAIGGTYHLADGSGAFAGSGVFCGERTIPAGNAVLAVIRLEAVNGPLACADAGEALAGAPTKGLIAARLR